MGLGLWASAIVAPALFWIGYLYYKDRYEPEPLRTVGLSYLLGILAGAVCTLAYRATLWVGLPADPQAMLETNAAGFALYAVGVIGPLEELAKLLPFVLVCLWFRDLNEPLDGIIYSSCIALGFASYENLDYLPEMSGFALYGRAFASPVVHTLFASIWGFLGARARLNPRRSIVLDLALGVLLASVAHGLYDLLVFAPGLQLAAALLVLVVWIWRILLVQRLHRSVGTDV